MKRKGELLMYVLIAIFGIGCGSMKSKRLMSSDSISAICGKKKQL